MGKPKRNLFPNIFSGLVFYIISQQISAKAAETEWKRFQELCSPVKPENTRRFTPEKIQKCGTTLRRAGYIRLIAEKLADNTIDVNSLIKEDDAEFIKKKSQNCRMSENGQLRCF